ncbi:P-loop containing nucleoside triphosphate hydrolase protein [Coprinellus micaceus]|uniref:P-loop containing nucleoside triphosphate hydrolase protein n=1 Tax=Coprinellus micaceus TaxID=71717 RepID=A0A4Y7TRM6_COPMI|nr:P-loop containing nucleoside triphosphate hydrolase protein [Coprinellus micaceus]
MSAPPTAGPSRVVSKPPSTAAGTRARTISRPGLRSASAATKKVTPPKPSITTIQSQLAELEAARQADAERLSAEMDVERSKMSRIAEQPSQSSRNSYRRRKALELSHKRELVSCRLKHSKEVMELEMDLRKKEREAREVTEDLRVTRNELERERGTVDHLRTTLAGQSQAQLTLTAENTALQNTVVEEVFESETIRRKLHNTILELKGNIRVFCRVRPRFETLDEEERERTKEEMKARMAFPDSDSGEGKKDIVLHSSSESAMGNEAEGGVFEPESTQAEVFEEISQLAQSCIDGYNVCIFAYGQTGSGKSFTMEGGPESDRKSTAVEQVFRVAEEMRSKGWEYKIEGQFLEIHDPKSGRTTVTDATVVLLRSPSQVKTLLARRSKSAKRSSDAHERTLEPLALRVHAPDIWSKRRFPEPCPLHPPPSDWSRCFERRGSRSGYRGTMRRVSEPRRPRGSERLNVSFGPGVTEKERVKETQNINKSLSALGDVIAALGEKGIVTANGGAREVHIPYRNSKLTYLLQNSLSGSSKTLMVLNLSPLAAHLNESLTSLRFATKVNNTRIGPGKKTTPVPA